MTFLFALALAATPWIVVASCTPSERAQVLNVADVVCAIDNLDPGLASSAVNSAVQKACGALPDPRILDAQKRALARVAAPPSSSSR